MSNTPTPHAHSGRPRNQETQAWSTVQARLQAFLSLQQKSISNIKQVNMLQAQFNNETEPIATLQPKLEKAYQAALQDTQEQEKFVNQGIEALSALIAHRNVQGHNESTPGQNHPDKRQKKRRLEGPDGSGLPMSREGSRASPAPSQHSAVATSISHSGSSAGGKRPPPAMNQMGRPAAGSSSAVPQTITVTTSMKPVSSQQQQQQQQKKVKRDGQANASSSSVAVGSSSTTNASNILAPGRPVAAKQPSDPSRPPDDSDDYILAKVVRYLGHDTYSVQDVEGEGGKPGDIFSASIKHIVQLPDPKDKSTFPPVEVPAGSSVMAVYPDTTSLYHGKVVGIPTGPRHKREDKDNVYKIVFDDDGNQIRFVPAHLVVKWKT